MKSVTEIRDQTYLLVTIHWGEPFWPNGEFTTVPRDPSGLIRNEATPLVAVFDTNKKVLLASTVRKPGAVAAIVPTPSVVNGEPVTCAKTPAVDLNAETSFDPLLET